MAVKPTAPRVMNGKWGMVYFDGEPVYETDSYEAKIKIEREDVDFVMQMAKDSKLMYAFRLSQKLRIPMPTAVSGL